ncbi:MAG: hypothetical protein ACT4O3_00415 [Elusimicrobiota bacterium]
MRGKTRLAGTAALVAAAASALAASTAVLGVLGQARLKASVAAGLAGALLLVLPSYWTLAWALRRSDKVFFSAFAGGFLFRLAGFAAAAYAAHRFTSLSLPALALAAAGGLILLSFVEVYFIQRETR